jgi:hypothetical protein
MTPVYQTMTVMKDERGNCFNACVASILEMPLRETCQALPGDEDYWLQWDNWFEERGLRLERWDETPPGYAIATGYGGRTYPEGHQRAGEEILHAAVVYDGKVIHDPFPHAEQFDRIKYYWAISEDREWIAA